MTDQPDYIAVWKQVDNLHRLSETHDLSTDHCHSCGEPWPCSARRVLDALKEAQGQRDTAEARIAELEAYKAVTPSHHAFHHANEVHTETIEDQNKALREALREIQCVIHRDGGTIRRATKWKSEYYFNPKQCSLDHCRRATAALKEGEE